MVFQKPYLNIACKRSAQRAVPSWEQTKVSTKLIRVISRQPKENKKEKKSALALSISARAPNAGVDKPQFAAQAHREMLWFLGEPLHGTNVEGG